MREQKPKQISAKDAVFAVQAGEMQLLDVREFHEIKASGQAKGALFMPLALIPLHKSELCRSKPIAIYCAAGGRAGQAANYLRAHGYEAYNIGSYAHWIAAGGASV